MVPVAEVPPVTLFGEMTKSVIAAGSIVRVDVLIAPLNDADKVTFSIAATPDVPIVK